MRVGDGGLLQQTVSDLYAVLNTMLERTSTVAASCSVALSGLSDSFFARAGDRRDSGGEGGG